MENILNFKGFLNEAETQDDAHLLFNGNTLDFIENGSVVKSWRACSGRSYYQWYVKPESWKRRYNLSPVEWSKVKAEGPIPQGTYKLGPTEERDLNARWRNDENFVKLTLAKQTVLMLPDNDVTLSTDDFKEITDPSRIAWGNFRFALIPQKGTNSFGRGGFFLHGGSLPGSIGCIDLVTEIKDFGQFYKDWLQKTGNTSIKLIVDYKTFDKNEPIDVDSQPYKMYYNPLESDPGYKKWYSESDAQIKDILSANKIRMDYNKVLAARRN
jgi:hypothetical protein